MIDLSGTMPPRPEEAVRLWGSCAGQAATRSHLWRFPAPRGDDLLREQLFLEPDGADLLRQGLVEPTLASAAAFQHRLSERSGEPARFADAVATCGLFAPDAVREAQW